ncbi:hypothetical protein SH611_17340 [Geminicoccaceae bacterium 1502E]|nr:hypothetical protein [Geminicoccaceae bacterium 1502E]
MRALALALVSLSAACTPAAEIERQMEEASREGCLEAGFAETSDAWKLCLLLQDSNRRLEAMERRLLWLESDIRFHDRPWYGYRR